MLETQSSRKRLLLATTGLGTVMTTMSIMGAMAPADASTLIATSQNTFATVLSATGNAVISGTTVQLNLAVTVATGNFLTFSLPSGLTFAANPTVTAASAGGVSVSTGGSGAQTVVYQVTTAMSGASALSLTGLQVSGLQTYISTNSTATTFNISATFPADTVVTATTNALALITGASSAAPTLGAAQTIDVSSGGVRFISGTANALFVPLGQVTFANVASQPNDVSGGTLVSMTSAGGTITVTGPLTGLTTVYAIATAVASTCATAAPTGAFTATPSATAATLTGLSVSTFQVCAIANGSTILSSGAISTRGLITLSNSGAVTGAATANAVGYSGNVRNMQYFVGATGGYGSFAYAVNSGTTAATALVTVRRNDGATATGSLASLAAGASALYGASDVNTAVGSSFMVDASSRAQVTFLFSTTSVNLTGLLLNPGGVVTGMGQQFSN